MMKTFGLIVPAGKGSTFEANVRALLADYAELASILLPLLGEHSVPIEATKTAMPSQRRCCRTIYSRTPTAAASASTA